MSDRILIEIRRLARDSGGQPPGKAAFARDTGIAEHQWSGVLWARWSDALADAGFVPNVLQRRFDSDDVLSKIIEACRHYGRVPTVAEMKLYRCGDPSFPSKGAISGHFRTRVELISALARRSVEDESCRDIANLLPNNTGQANDPLPSSLSRRTDDGWVYLIKSGDYYKVGRSDDLERRVKQIRISLPEAASLVHAIRTDDPSGIEAYWHKRFSDRRANGEWFKLAASDVMAFNRRKYQ